jgi:hypothetical protein
MKKPPINVDGVKKRRAKNLRGRRRRDSCRFFKCNALSNLDKGAATSGSDFYGRKTTASVAAKQERAFFDALNRF